jgi:Malectin domain
VIPVAGGRTYTVKLYFFEHWFGAPNGSIGGAGSRVFDVWCNGSVLLKSFDIYREAGSGPLIKTFNHIEPTPQDKIELYFLPRTNYPSVSAIEVLPE